MLQQCLILIIGSKGSRKDKRMGLIAIKKLRRNFYGE